MNQLSSHVVLSVNLSQVANPFIFFSNIFFLKAIAVSQNFCGIFFLFFHKSVSKPCMKIVNLFIEDFVDSCNIVGFGKVILPIHIEIHIQVEMM